MSCNRSGSRCATTHGSVTPEWGALRPPAESWARRRATYVDMFDDVHPIGFDEALRRAVAEDPELWPRRQGL